MALYLVVGQLARVEEPAAAGAESSGSRPGPFARILLVWMLPPGIPLLLASGAPQEAKGVDPR